MVRTLPGGIQCLGERELCRVSLEQFRIIWRPMNESLVDPFLCGGYQF